MKLPEALFKFDVWVGKAAVGAGAAGDSAGRKGSKQLEDKDKLFLTVLNFGAEEFRSGRFFAPKPAGVGSITIRDSAAGLGAHLYTGNEDQLIAHAQSTVRNALNLQRHYSRYVVILLPYLLAEPFRFGGPVLGSPRMGNEPGTGQIYLSAWDYYKERLGSLLRNAQERDRSAATHIRIVDLEKEGADLGPQETPGEVGGGGWGAVSGGKGGRAKLYPNADGHKKIATVLLTDLGEMLKQEERESMSPSERRRKLELENRQESSSDSSGSSFRTAVSSLKNKVASWFGGSEREKPQVGKGSGSDTSSSYRSISSGESQDSQSSARTGYGLFSQSKEGAHLFSPEYYRGIGKTGGALQEVEIVNAGNSGATSTVVFCETQVTPVAGHAQKVRVVRDAEGVRDPAKDPTYTAQRKSPQDSLLSQIVDPQSVDQRFFLTTIFFGTNEVNLRKLVDPNGRCTTTLLADNVIGLATKAISFSQHVIAILPFIEKHELLGQTSRPCWQEYKKHIDKKIEVLSKEHPGKIGLVDLNAEAAGFAGKPVSHAKGSAPRFYTLDNPAPAPGGPWYDQLHPDEDGH
eukprot:g14174.t1